MKKMSDDETSMIWKFPYKKGNASKIIFKCTCGAENEMFDIKRDGWCQSNKGNSWDILIDNPVESSVSFKCGICEQTIEVVHRGYTHDEEIEERNSKINNLLNFKHYKST